MRAVLVEEHPDGGRWLNKDEDVPWVTLTCLRNYVDDIYQETLAAEDPGPLELTFRVAMTF